MRMCKHLRSITLLAVLLAPASSALAQGGTHPVDVITRAEDGALVIGGFTDGALTFPKRVFTNGTELGDIVPGVTFNPGFDSLPDQFPQSVVVGVTIRAALRVWDGSDFDTLAPVTMTVRQDGIDAITPASDPADPSAGPSLTIGLTDPIDGRLHEHPGYRLDAPAPDGLYLLELELFVDPAAASRSDPFWIIFVQDEGGAGLSDQLDDAAAWVEDNLAGNDCPADFNEDGFSNDQDFFDFVNAFFGPGPADFNADGFTNDQDFFDFVNAFFANDLCN